MSELSCRPYIGSCTYKQCLDCGEYRRCCGWICARCLFQSKVRYKYQTDAAYRKKMTEARKRYYWRAKRKWEAKK